MLIKRSVNWKDFERAAKDLAIKIESEKWDIGSVYGIPRGGLILAVRLSHLLGIPYTNKIHPDTLVVDDVSDSGESLLVALGFQECRVATWHYKPKTSKFKPDVYAEETDEWIVYPWEVKAWEKTKS